MFLGDQQLQHILLFLAVPMLAFLAFCVNLFMRARGRRSFKFELSAFGVQVKLESFDRCHKPSEDAERE